MYLHNVVLNARHTQILHHALNLGIADVGSVDVREKIEYSKNRYKSQVDFPDHSLPLILGEVLVKVGLFMGQAHTSILVVFIDVDFFEILGD